MQGSLLSYLFCSVNIELCFSIYRRYFIGPGALPCGNSFTAQSRLYPIDCHGNAATLHECHCQAMLCIHSILELTPSNPVFPSVSPNVSLTCLYLWILY